MYSDGIRTVQRVDEHPDPTEACTHYHVIVGDKFNWNVLESIHFQNGYESNDVNGVTNECLLAMVRDRLEKYQEGPLKCPENMQALNGINAALTALERRTQLRKTQNVEGTDKPHTSTIP